MIVLLLFVVLVLVSLDFCAVGCSFTTILTVATPACPLPSSKHQAPGVVKGQACVGLACNVVIFGV